MKIYKLENYGISGFGHADAIVVAAYNEGQARRVAADHAVPPSHIESKKIEWYREALREMRDSWLSGEELDVHEVGDYTGRRKTAHVILASYIGD